MCFRKLSFFKTVTLWICDTTQYMKDISHLKIACCYLKEFLRLLWLKGRQEELVYFSLKSMTLQSHQGRRVQEFTRPIHLPGVFEGHLKPPAKGSNPLPPHQHGGGTGTSHRSFPGRTQCCSRRAPAGATLGLGAVLGSPGFIRIQEKELGMMASYVREPCIFCSQLLQTLQSLGILEGSGKIHWRCYFRGRVLSHVPSAIWMSGRRRQSLGTLGLLKSLLLVWSR